MRSRLHSHDSAALNRRLFLQTTAAGFLGLGLPSVASAGETSPRGDTDSFDALSRDLLRDWCDGLLALRIDTPSDPARHGALDCPGCKVIHGRCMDAVYPFLHMAKVTGEKKYLSAGIDVFEWSENVTLENGAWTNDLNPKSWQGTTLFGAIAVAEALHHHGDLLDAATRQRWLERLGRAADFIYQTITRMEFANINYGCTAIFGMHLLGKTLDRPPYLERSRQLAASLDKYISEPSGLLFGEGKPCVNHTFTHAKALAVVRDHKGLAQKIRVTAPLPRAVADGVRHYPEIATWLAARGPWRATITATDWFYRDKVRQPTGGCMSLLLHQQVGPLFAGSMPRYVRVEPHNMQVHPHPGDHPLTPRVELRDGKSWFTQLYDLAAEVKHGDADGRLSFDVSTRLLDESGEAPPQGRAECALTYVLDSEAATITASAPGVGNDAARPRLVLPIISPTGEMVSRVSANRIEIRKPGGTLIIEANAALEIEDSARPRIFNLVPGFEAVPVFAEVPADGTLTCRTRVMK